MDEKWIYGWIGMRMDDSGWVDGRMDLRGVDKTNVFDG